MWQSIIPFIHGEKNIVDKLNQNNFQEVTCHKVQRWSLISFLQPAQQDNFLVQGMEIVFSKFLEHNHQKSEKTQTVSITSWSEASETGNIFFWHLVAMSK